MTYHLVYWCYWLFQKFLRMETLLKDILYDEEKERIANKYRLAVIKIGDVVKHFKPKQKGLILDAFRDYS